jgi:hypothetical protein
LGGWALLQAGAGLAEIRRALGSIDDADALAAA